MKVAIIFIIPLLSVIKFFEGSDIHVYKGFLHL